MCGAHTSTDTDTDINDGAPYLHYVFVNQGKQVIGCLWPSDAAQSDQIDQPIAHQLFSQPVLSPCTTSFLKPGQSGQSTESPLKPAVPCDQPELGSGLSLVRMGENSGRKLRTRRSMTHYPLVESEMPAELDSTGAEIDRPQTVFSAMYRSPAHSRRFFYSFAYTHLHTVELRWTDAK